MSDVSLLLDHLRTGLRPEELADVYGITKSAARGQVSRAKNSTKYRTEGFQTLLEQRPTETAAEREIAKLVERHQTAFELIKKFERSLQLRRKLVWISDVHFPHTRRDALELALLLVEYIQPNWITTLNDLLDNQDYGGHNDYRSVAEKLWSNDPALVRRTVNYWHVQLKAAAADANLVAVWGNHDLWYIGEKAKSGTGQQDVLNFLQELESDGVIIPEAAPYRQNIVQLSPGLKLTHGVSAAAKNVTVAKATIEKLGGTSDTGDAGVYYNTASGHVHRSFVIRHNGVMHYNFGTLRNEDARWMKYAPNWTLGIGYIEYDPNSRAVEGTPIDFHREGRELVAYFHGRRFAVNYLGNE